MKRIALALFYLAAFCSAALAQQPITSNLVSGSASATGTSATTIIAAPTTTRLIYVTAVQCGRNDTGTTASYVTFNDNAATIMVLPNSGGGGANTMTLSHPLVVPAATAFKFTSSASISTVYCNARGFSGN
jgi:hypothetical protein